jgi:hypothetical protein
VRGTLAALVLLACNLDNAEAVVIPETQVYFGPNVFGFPPAEYQATIRQGPTLDASPTSVWFETAPAFPGGPMTLRITSWNLDEGADFYIAQFGAEFSTETINRGDFPSLLRTPLTTPPSPSIATPRLLPTGDFYLGIYTGLGFTSYYPNLGHPYRDTYGWVHVRNIDGELTMLGNAMAYGERGIAVGTLEAVPEPTTALFAFGILGVAAFSRRWCLQH